MRKAFASNPFLATRSTASAQEGAVPAVIHLEAYRRPTAIINPMAHNVSMDRLVARLNHWLDQVETQALRPPLS